MNFIPELKRGESAFFHSRLSSAQLREIALQLKAKCGCGGNMIPKRGSKKLEWVCERDQWWRFWNRKHAHLVAEVSVMPQAQGSA